MQTPRPDPALCAKYEFCPPGTLAELKRQRARADEQACEIDALTDLVRVRDAEIDRLRASADLEVHLAALADNHGRGAALDRLYVLGADPPPKNPTDGEE